MPATLSLPPYRVPTSNSFHKPHGLTLSCSCYFHFLLFVRSSHAVVLFCCSYRSKPTTQQLLGPHGVAVTLFVVRVVLWTCCLCANLIVVSNMHTLPCYPALAPSLDRKYYFWLIPSGPHVRFVNRMALHFHTFDFFFPRPTSFFLALVILFQVPEIRHYCADDVRRRGDSSSAMSCLQQAPYQKVYNTCEWRTQPEA